MKEEVAGSAKHELEDGEIIKIVKKLIKQRKDSAEQIESGGRAELAEKEKAEIIILETYLPEQMSEEEVVKIIESKKVELGVDDKSKMGVLIGAVMKEVGDSADGSVVKDLVIKTLG